MSSTQSVAAPPQPFRLRVWPLLLILALAAAVGAVVWTWPAPDWERGGRVICTYTVVMLAFLGAAVWWVFLSGLRWWAGLATLPVILIVLYGIRRLTIREVAFNGDMVPTFSFTWDERPEDRLRRHREQQGEKTTDKVADIAVRGDDFAEYRGPRRDGVADGPPLARDWKAKPPRELWRQPIGGGWAAFAVAGGRAVTIEQRDKDEAVVCYDAATGQELWVHTYPAEFKEPLGGPGPRATPTIVDGEVFSLGATGDLVCLDLATGEKRWAVNILGTNKNLQWAMSGSPLVYDDFVVVSAGKNDPADADRTLVAYDRKTSKEVWASGAHQAGYSSPMLVTIGGTRQVVLFDGAGIGGYDASKGEELWRHPLETHMGINVAQPLVLEGDRLFVTSGYGVGCAALEIKKKDGKWSAEPAWQTKAMRCQFTSPVLGSDRKYAYGLDAGILVCVDVSNGERKWRSTQRYGHGQLLRSGDLLVVTSEQPGDLVLVEATPREHRELGRIRVFESKTWNVPALAGGRVYLRNDREMACYDLRDP